MRFIVSRSPQSACSNSMPSGRFRRSPPIMLSQPSTWSPLLVNASARWLPRKPATPETKTFNSEGSGSSKYGGNCPDEDAHIEPERPLLNVLTIEVNDILKVENVAAAA